MKARALTLKNWIDDTEIEEEVGIFFYSLAATPRTNALFFFHRHPPSTPLAKKKKKKKKKKKTKKNARKKKVLKGRVPERAREHGLG